MCAALHNFGIRGGIPLLGRANDPLPEEDREDDRNYVGNGGNVPLMPNALLEEARNKRNQIINTYF